MFCPQVSFDEKFIFCESVSNMVCGSVNNIMEKGWTDFRARNVQNRLKMIQGTFLATLARLFRVPPIRRDRGLIYQCVYDNLIPVMLRIIYLAEPPHGIMFTGTNHQPVIRTQFYFQCFIKDKAIQFQLKYSNLLPHYQWPPSPRVAGSAVTSFPAKTLNCHISRTRHTRIPSFAFNWDLVSSNLYTKNHAISSTGTSRIWPVLVPLWSGRNSAGKKVTAVSFFRCPTVSVMSSKLRGFQGRFDISSG